MDLRFHLLQIFFPMGNPLHLFFQFFLLFENIGNRASVFPLHLLDREQAFFHLIDIVFGEIHVFETLPERIDGIIQIVIAVADLRLGDSKHIAVLQSLHRAIQFIQRLAD